MNGESGLEGHPFVFEERDGPRIELHHGPPGAASGPRIVLRSRFGAISYPAIRIRSMRVRQGKRGSTLVLRLFSEEQAIIPLSSPRRAGELMRKFAATVNERLASEPGGPFARGIEEAFRRIHETEQGRNE